MSTATDHTPTTSQGIPEDTVFPVFVAPTRTTVTWEATRVSWAQLLEWAANPADHKECGNYVLGRFQGLRRVKTAVTSRAALTLDADAGAGQDFPDRLAELGFTCLYHTTFSSTPAEPRFRVIVPLDREVEPFEYSMLAAVVISRVGQDRFDPGSIQPERYMFKPSTQDPDSYRWGVVGEGPAVVDELLGAYSSEVVSDDLRPSVPRSKRDPFQLGEPVGAFNRVYRDFDLLISTYDLPYEAAGPGRWKYLDADGAAGLSLVADGLVYSHHSHDPASGGARTAFDLVRLHEFAALDRDVKPETPINRLPSYEAMQKKAQQDEAVYLELVPQAAKEFADAADQVAAGPLVLDLDKQGRPTDTVENWDRIRGHDALFSRIFFNELAQATEISGAMPWREFDPTETVFDSTDRASLGLYVEREYGLKAPRERLDMVLAECAKANARNPLRDLLETLEWDGTPRLETCLPGVEVNDYTRMVAKRIMVGAVARALSPGCKVDHTLVLYGPEGLGKSWWIDKMAMGFSASLGPIGAKDTLLTMQRSWIMTSDEGYALTKSDSEKVKEFITRPVDVFRAPYDREAKAHPRHCVIWGTTNDREFLRKQEGNRRFLIVECSRAVDFEALTPDYVRQVWAEAVALFKMGEPWFLSADETKLAHQMREGFTEADFREGVIQAFLNTPLPAAWDSMTVLERQMWLNVSDQREIQARGEKVLDRTCAPQVWAEALGHRLSDQDRGEIKELGVLLDHLEGWVRLPERAEIPGYGLQVAYRRLSAAEAELL